MIYLGYSPGGCSRSMSKSGVAILTQYDDGPHYQTGTVACVDDAVQWYSDRLMGEVPRAIGIDAPLFWETSRGGWRAADKWLKVNYSEMKRSVISSNSIQGALVIQGVALAISLKRKWGGIILTETSSKLLYHALTKDRYEWAERVINWPREALGVKGDCIINSPNEWSALLACWSSRMGHTQEAGA